MTTPRLRIGLTGGVASGKSTVAQRFRELGVPVIDADECARAAVARGTPGLAAVVEKFGAGFLTPAGELDRRALREVIFADPSRRAELEAILHPLIRADMEKRAAAATGPYVVLAVPLLIEGGNATPVHRTLVVDVDEEVQIDRLVARDGGTREQAAAILAAQASRSARRQKASDLIRNSGTVAELRHAVDQLHQRYLSLSENLAERGGRLT